MAEKHRITNELCSRLIYPYTFCKGYPVSYNRTRKIQLAKLTALGTLDGIYVNCTILKQIFVITVLIYFIPNEVMGHHIQYKQIGCYMNIILMANFKRIPYE